MFIKSTGSIYIYIYGDAANNRQSITLLPVYEYVSYVAYSIMKLLQPL